MNQKIPYHTIFRLAIQMINAHEFIHSCKYVHADLKASHILFDGSTYQQAYLCDFSYAVPYVKRKYEENKEMSHYGSTEYCSRDAHLVDIIFSFITFSSRTVRIVREISLTFLQGIPTMRGDMETLGYNLFHWSTSTMP